MANLVEGAPGEDGREVCGEDAAEARVAKDGLAVDRVVRDRLVGAGAREVDQPAGWTALGENRRETDRGVVFGDLRPGGARTEIIWRSDGDRAETRRRPTEARSLVACNQTGASQRDGGAARRCSRRGLWPPGCPCMCTCYVHVLCACVMCMCYVHVHVHVHVYGHLDALPLAAVRAFDRPVPEGLAFLLQPIVPTRGATTKSRATVRPCDRATVRPCGRARWGEG